MRSLVVGFLFVPEMNYVVLIKKHRPAWQEGKYNGVGGHVEAGETFAQAMEREALEEIGVRCRWIHYANVVFENTVIAFYYARDQNALHTRDLTDEHAALAKVPLAPDMPVIPNLHWLIPAAINHAIMQANAQNDFLPGEDLLTVTYPSDVLARCL